MSKFEQANYFNYVCNSCNKRCNQYHVFVQHTLFPQYVYSVNDFLDRMKEKPENLHFLCTSCYNKKLIEQMPVLEKVNELNTEITNQQKQIHELNSRIEQLLKPQICMFQFDEMQKEYKELESQIGKLQELIGNKTIQTESEKLKEMFKTQNNQGLLKISQKIEQLLQQNIDETKENVEKILEMKSSFYSISSELTDKNVVSKVKIEQFIEEEIQNQNLDKKIELQQDLQKFMERFGVEPQSDQAEKETQQ